MTPSGNASPWLSFRLEYGAVEIILIRNRSPSIRRANGPDPACTGILFRRVGDLVFDEEILVESFHLDGAADANADAMFDHQIGQLAAVDQDHPLR